MTDVDLARAQELVEGRFDSVGSGPPQTATYSFRVDFPAEELTEKQKRSVYQAVIGFADQLKRQTGRPVLRWRVKPEISTEMQFDPQIKVRTLFFRVSADDE